MRSLKKLLEKIYRKSALALVRRGEEHLPPLPAGTLGAPAGASGHSKPLPAFSSRLSRRSPAGWTGHWSVELRHALAADATLGARLCSCDFIR